MTLAKAYKALEPPLIFGCDAQICAVRFIEAVEGALALYHACGERHTDYFPKEAAFDARCDCVADVDKETLDGAEALWKKQGDWYERSLR